MIFRKHIESHVARVLNIPYSNWPIFRIESKDSPRGIHTRDLDAILIVSFARNHLTTDHKATGYGLMTEGHKNEKQGRQIIFSGLPGRHKSKSQKIYLHDCFSKSCLDRLVLFIAICFSLIMRSNKWRSSIAISYQAFL